MAIATAVLIRIHRHGAAFRFCRKERRHIYIVVRIAVVRLCPVVGIAIHGTVYVVVEPASAYSRPAVVLLITRRMPYVPLLICARRLASYHTVGPIET